MYFRIFHNADDIENYEKNLNPELAIKFKIKLLQIFSHIIYLVFTFYDIPEEKKKSILEKLVRFACNELILLKNKDLDEYEIFKKISKSVDEKLSDILSSNEVESSHEEHTTERHLLCFWAICKFVKKSFAGNPFKDIYEKLYEKMHKEFNLINVALMTCNAVIIGLFMTCSHIYKVNAVMIIRLNVMIWLLVFFVLFRRMVKLDAKVNMIKNNKDEFELCENLGVDILCLEVPDELLPIVDPYLKNEFLPAISDFRLSLTDEYGYVLENIRIIDSSNFEKGIKFLVRSKEVCHFDFHKDMYVIFEKDAIDNDITIPSECTCCELDERRYFWVDESFCNNLDSKLFYTRPEILKEMLNFVSFKYIDKIFTLQQTYMLIDITRKLCPIDEYIDVIDLREILVDILKRGGSKKDITFVFERIIHYLKSNNDFGFIAFSICRDLKFNETPNQ